MESVRIGQVTCDFAAKEEVYSTTAQWLTSSGFHHIVTLNPEMVVLASRDATFADAAANADMRIPDGSGLFWARQYLSGDQSLLPSLIRFSGKKAARVTGTDILLALVRQATAAGKSTYLLGGTEQEAHTTANVIKRAIAGATVFTGPVHTFDIEGPHNVLADIQQKSPGLLLVAYGAPKQTVWIERHKGALPSVRVAVGVGGAFAMLGGQAPRAPQSLRDHNIEWAWRLFLQPARLPRIWRAVISFPHLIYQQKRGKVGVDE